MHIFGVPTFTSTTKIQREGHPERQKKSEMVAGEEKKKERNVGRSRGGEVRRSPNPQPQPHQHQHRQKMEGGSRKSVVEGRGANWPPKGEGLPLPGFGGSGLNVVWSFGLGVWAFSQKH